VLLDSVQQWPALPFAGAGDLWSYTVATRASAILRNGWWIPPGPTSASRRVLELDASATGILYYRSDGWSAGNTIGSWNNVNTTACGGGLGKTGRWNIPVSSGPPSAQPNPPGNTIEGHS